MTMEAIQATSSTVWNTISTYSSTAGSWLNENVVQFAASYFKAMTDHVSANKGICIAILSGVALGITVTGLACWAIWGRNSKTPSTQGTPKADTPTTTNNEVPSEA